MTTQRAHLVGYGRLDWATAHATIGQVDSCWADLDGWHIAPLPVTAPHTTHLWGWRDDVCWRLRVDGDEAVVAALHLGQPSSAPSNAPVAEQVLARISAATPWPRDDRQVSLRGDSPDRWSWQIVELPGPAPISFVRALPAASASTGQPG